MDVLAASLNDNTVWYFDSDGASPPVFTTRTITSSSGGALSVVGADYDTDGDVDIVVCSKADGAINVYANSGSAVPIWTVASVTSSSGFPMAMALGDVAHDGTLDVVREQRRGWGVGSALCVPVSRTPYVVHICCC